VSGFGLHNRWERILCWEVLLVAVVKYFVFLSFLLSMLYLRVVRRWSEQAGQRRVYGESWYLGLLFIVFTHLIERIVAPAPTHSSNNSVE